METRLVVVPRCTLVAFIQWWRGGCDDPDEEAKTLIDRGLPKLYSGVKNETQKQAHQRH